jgi:hypothetical protein
MFSYFWPAGHWSAPDRVEDDEQEICYASTDGPEGDAGRKQPATTSKVGVVLERSFQDRKLSHHGGWVHSTIVGTWGVRRSSRCNYFLSKVTH